jgi:hypothetical protein
LPVSRPEIFQRGDESFGRVLIGPFDPSRTTMVDVLVWSLDRGRPFGKRVFLARGSKPSLSPLTKTGGGGIQGNDGEVGGSKPLGAVPLAGNPIVVPIEPVNVASPEVQAVLEAGLSLVLRREVPAVVEVGGAVAIAVLGRSMPRA